MTWELILDGYSESSYSATPRFAAARLPWFPEKKQSNVSQIWHAFEHEEHANTFSAFLDRLSDTVSARNTSGFREQVAAWLEKLSASAELRQQSFAVAADATESCEDRVALTWNNLRKTLLVHQASEGLFDNDTGALLSLGREMFRLEILEDIARDKVRTLHFVDEIEVYLAFQTMLAEKLQLSTAVKEMRFYGVSGVTANDLRTAEATVRSREENEFTDWFSLWGPWHAVLKRTEADRWAQAEEQKYEMLENEYSQRVADRLKASGLSGDADAEREAGAQVMRETEQQIYRQLLREGIRVARCTVARLMAVMGLAGVLRGKKVRTTISRKAVAAGDRVNRQFVAERPDQLRVADFTYASTWQGFVYVAFIIDVFAGYIVGWRVSSSMETTFVLDALEQALWARRPSGTVHHSDKGSQYVSLAYTQRLKEAGLLASTGSTGDSYDNAMAESINGLYKAEVIHRKSWKNRAEVELATLTWVDWYNNRRLLERLGHTPPAEAEKAYYASIGNDDLAA